MVSVEIERPVEDLTESHWPQVSVCHVSSQAGVRGSQITTRGYRHRTYL
jgi:hypothetical protein